MKKIQSVEPKIAELANGWLKSFGLDYKLEQESLNHEIDNALAEYFSKSGGNGGNRPDAKLLLANNSHRYPVLIEYKGYKDKLVKLDGEGKVENRNAKNEPHYSNIKNYAVNGAVHYANAILHYTSYTDVFAIGMTGYKDETEKLNHEISVYYVSKKNYGIGQEVGKYTDLSFLKKENFPGFIDDVKKISLTEEERENLKKIRESEQTIFPVGEGSLDEFKGVIYAKDLLDAVLNLNPNEKIDLTTLLKKPVFVPRTMEIFRLVEKFKTSGATAGIVNDEYGGVIGFVTLDDIAGEIVGTNDDEPREKQFLQKDNAYIVDGLCDIDDFKSQFNIETLPDEEHEYFHTMGGFLTSLFGYIPKVGETYEWNGLKFEVMKMDRARIAKIRITEIP